MTTEIAKYDAALRALAEAVTADEVKSIRDKAVALKFSAKIARNRQLEADALELRLRAERRLGELMEEGKDDRAGHGGDRKSRDATNPLKPTLGEIGIDKNLASRARKLYALPEDDFTDKVADGRDKILASAAKVISALVKPPAKPKAKNPPPLSPESWHRANPDDRKRFVMTVKPSMIVASVGTRDFWKGLSGEQREALAGAMEQAKSRTAEDSPAVAVLPKVLEIKGAA